LGAASPKAHSGAPGNAEGQSSGFKRPNAKQLCTRRRVEGPPRRTADAAVGAKGGL